jgi:hypothetical protein
MKSELWDGDLSKFCAQNVSCLFSIVYQNRIARTHLITQSKHGNFMQIAVNRKTSYANGHSVAANGSILEREGPDGWEKGG